MEPAKKPPLSKEIQRFDYPPAEANIFCRRAHLYADICYDFEPRQGFLNVATFRKPQPQPSAASATSQVQPPPPEGEQEEQQQQQEEPQDSEIEQEVVGDIEGEKNNGTDETNEEDDVATSVTETVE